jgi:hypothetical protein
MKKVTLLAGAMAVALSTSVMAEDFRALGNIQAAPVQNAELAATEGGTVCDNTGTNTEGGGVSLCSFLLAGNGNVSIFTVSNEAPVTSAQFLSVVGF